MTKRLLVLLALALLVVDCGPDPVKIEKAGAIRRESEVQYLATATAVAIIQDFAEIRAKATATAVADEEQMRAATQNNRIARQESVIWWSTVAAIVFLLALAASLSVASAGGAVAVVRYANLQARLIWLNEVTRTFPILVERGLLVDFEAGERARLDSPHEPHPGRLIGSIQTRVTDLLAQAAAQMAKATKDGSAGSSLPSIGHGVPLLDSSHWLPELKERRLENARQDVAEINGDLA